MAAGIQFSPSLQELIETVQRLLSIQILVHRDKDAPDEGVLVDTYTYGSPQTVITFPARQLGILKDYVIAENCVVLLLRGAAHAKGGLVFPSFDVPSATAGMRQIYLDACKDEKTRAIPVSKKKKISFFLYRVFQETLSDLPWRIMANIYIARRCDSMRNAQVYLLMKESMREMHDLVSFRDLVPRRYFAMHNAMYYARDMILADVLASYKLNPVINIPELHRFKNLNVKEMLTHRWSESAWYHTKVVGDIFYRDISQSLLGFPEGEMTLETWQRFFEVGVEATNRWMSLAQCEGWYPWHPPSHLLSALKAERTIEAAAGDALFGT